MNRKTKTPKGRRSGIYSRRPKINPPRLQTPYTRKVRENGGEVERIVRAPYVGKTAMREAFENIVPPRERSRTVGKILRALRRGVGTFKAAGCRVRRG